MIEAKDILHDLHRATSHKSKWIKEAKEDFEFRVGKQWEESDYQALWSRGVRALTINKIQPILLLLSGLERQNRTDFRAFPEGGEDSLTADIATRLLKNSIKQSMGEFKLSEQFEDGATCGEGWLEPFIDYTHDIVNGDLRLLKDSPFNVFPDPDSQEYDLSDADFVCKVSTNLTEKQIISLFPNKKDEIKKIGNGKMFHSVLLADGSPHMQLLDYPMTDENSPNPSEELKDTKTYDLVEYYYKKPIDKWLILDPMLGQHKLLDNKEKAYAYMEERNAVIDDENMYVIVSPRTVPEIWCASMIGNTVIDDSLNQFAPQWKGYPLIPFFGYDIQVDIKNKELKRQGVVRSLKDPQREMNQTRTQVLRHLKQSANSGWIAEAGAWVDENIVEKFGALPGISLFFKKGRPKPERISPTPLSQGHMQLAAEYGEDIKQISGLNSDLLAMSDDTASGRAIMLRQKQGMIMVQKLLDNYRRTKRILGRFILSQLGELYTVETARMVVGEKFITANFSEPVLQPSEIDGAPVPVVDEQGEMQMAVNEQAVLAMLNNVLVNDKMLKFDVAIGEAVSNDTIKMANFAALMEMVNNGIPIPPEVLIEESPVGETNKEKIKTAILEAQKAQAQAERANQSQGNPEK